VPDGEAAQAGVAELPAKLRLVEVVAGQEQPEVAVAAAAVVLQQHRRLQKTSNVPSRTFFM
jgi:hypothetical protein